MDTQEKFNFIASRQAEYVDAMVQKVANADYNGDLDALNASLDRTTNELWDALEKTKAMKRKSVGEIIVALNLMVLRSLAASANEERIAVELEWEAEEAAAEGAGMPISETVN